MKFFALLCTCMVLVSLSPVLASAVSHQSGASQHFQHPQMWQRSEGSTITQKTEKKKAQNSRNGMHRVEGRKNSKPSASGKQAKRFSVGAPTGKLGLLSAPQIATGGGLYNGSEYLSGDFNGDGKLDLITLVENNPGSFQYSISVELGNGDGTFQTAVLTAVPSNDNCATFLVGDVNGDHKDDVVVIHEASCTAGGFDVLTSNGDGSFTLANSYMFTDSDFSGGSLVDVNGDGKLDFIALDNHNPMARVWTALGDGTGAFGTATSVTLAAEGGNGTVFADLNGDGLLDIAEVDYSTNEVTVYLATSATTYASAVSYATSDSVFDACSLTAGDLNGDGKPELVNTNCADGTLTIFVNNGDGTFATGVYYNAATVGANRELNPGAAAIADVNGDGKPDIISTNMNSSDVTILPGNGDGTVNVPSIGYAVGGYAGNAAIVGDFDGDGKPDLVVSDFLFSLVFLKGYGDGTFRGAIDYYEPVSSGEPDGNTIATGDFNGDGNPDFVVGNCCETQAGITVFLSNPDGTLQPGVNYVSAESSQELLYVAVGDFNHDGKLDIAAADAFGFNTVVQIFNGVGDGTFTVGASYTSGESEDQAAGIIVGDFNNDGFTDIAVANNNDGAQDIGILLNDGTGNFLPVSTFSVSGEFSEVGMAVGDINNDGKLDIIAPLTFIDQVAIFLGNGDGTFQPEADLAIPSNGPVGAVLADFNGDGKLDMATTAYVRSTPGHGMYVALGNGDGTFQSPVFYQTTNEDQNLTLPYPQYVHAADMDGDGKLDLVYPNSDFGTVGILFGNGDGTFDAPLEFPAGQYAFDVAIVDINHDGTPDVVAADDDFAGATVLFNLNGTGTQSNYGVTTNKPSDTVAPGGSAVFDLTITPANHYNGIVTMSCGSLPALTTCTFVPPSFPMDGHTPVAVQLTVTTTAVSASINGPAPDLPSAPKSTPLLLAGLGGLGLMGMSFALRFKKARALGILFTIIAVPTIVSLSSCGKDCDDSPTACTTATTTTTSPAATTATVASSLNPAVAGQAITFTGTIASSGGTPTGTVKFIDGTTDLGTGTLSSGKASLQTAALAAGAHSITVSYAGDSSFKPSASAPLSETVDHPGTPAGMYTIPIKASGTAGTNGGSTALHSLSVSITVQ